MMKKYLTLACVTLLTPWLLLTVTAQEEAKKTYKETYDINSNTDLSIDNKFGKVDIKNWNQNKVEIVVDVIVHSSNKDKAEKSLNDISVKINKTGDKISANTSFGDIVSKSLGNSSKLGQGKIEVNYSVMMPSSVPLSLQNKYGSVFIDKLESKSSVEVSYGNLVANKISSAVKKPETEISLAYSSGNIEECQWIKINLKYSKLHIASSEALAALTKYSKLYIDEGTSLVSESKYDSYEVGHLKNFVTDAGYCHFKFDKIDTKIDVSMKYSELKVKYVPSGFEEIKIENTYGPCYLGIDGNASYTLDAKSEYGKIVYPESRASVNKSQDNQKTTISGIIGKKGSNSTVKINTKYGNINLTD